MENLKRSEKHKIFRDYGVPRDIWLDEKEKKREQIMWIWVALMMLALAFAGKTEAQRTFGLVALFITNILGVFYK